MTSASILGPLAEQLITPRNAALQPQRLDNGPSGPVHP
jgi:hypothetical protein